MNTTHVRRGTSPAALGLILILAGGAALAVRAAGIDLAEVFAEGGWPFFVIVPGLALLAMAFVVAAPDGVGFAIAGSIVTTVGLILLYQNATGDWVSWPYAWALIPAASGAGMTLYGLVVRRADFVARGLRIALIFAGVFLVAFWYFGALFATGQPPVDTGAWWPLIVIAVGLAITISGLVERRATKSVEATEMPSESKGTNAS